MIRRFALSMMMACLSILPFSLTANESNPQETDSTALTEEQQFQVWAQNFLDNLELKTGTVELPGGVATLQVPESFYYLTPEDTKKVLEDAWGNPPGGETMGMLFPAKYSPLHPEAWGVTIQYEEDGYVSDENAEDINYADMLQDMQEDTKLASEERVAAGYDPVELIGWAATPYYDKQNNKLHWAKEIRFGAGEESVDTLNYNIRILGRKGVLLINFIADMQQLPEIESNVETVLGIADFNEGFRYADFNPEIDEVAAYGIGALVAGKVLAKTGFLAAALLFLKKFGVIILIALGGIMAKLFSRKKAAS